MRLFQLEYSGTYLGGVALVLAPDGESARAILLAARPDKWIAERWSHAVSSAAIKEIAIPKFAAIIYNDDGDY